MTGTNSQGVHNVDDGAEGCSCDVRPCLAICHGEEENPSMTLYDITSQQTHRTRISPELANKYVYASYGDWLLVRDIKNKSDYSILNAVTMQKFQLPPIHKEHYMFSRFGSFLLSHSPSHASCTVWLFNCISTVLYCKIGADLFSEQSLPTGDDYSIAKATIFQGKVYYLTEGYGCLYYAELQDSPSYQFRKCIEGTQLKMLYRFYSLDYCNLIGSCDQLLYIEGRCLDMGAVDFQIFRADLKRKIWEKVYDIGNDRAIFVDQFRGFSALVPPNCGIKGNCIYYKPGQDEDDEDVNNITLFGYGLKDQRVTMLPPFPFKMHGRTQTPALPRLRWICS